MNGVYYINDDRAEYCSLPDPTRSQQVGIVGYLLVQGPFDGTNFSGYPELEEMTDEVEEWKARERRNEGKSFLRYVREVPDYIVSKYEREFDEEPDLDSTKFREFCAKQAYSTYRNDDGTWEEQMIRTSVGAEFRFDEYFDYFGRWAGDSVRLVVSPEELDGYEPITDDVVHEMHQTLPDQFLANGESVLTPDYVITSSDDDGGGDGDEADADNSGSNEKTLFPEA